MRIPRACRITAMALGLLLATPISGLTAEKITLDGSTGVMPLMAALAKVYQERHPAITIAMGKGLGTKARLQALGEGTIDIALASHGLVIEELTWQMAPPEGVPGGDMSGPFFMMRNQHTPTGSEPPAIANEVEGQYFGYFENRHGEQWVFVYDRVAQTGELRGGDVGWDTVIPVQEGQASIILGAAEAELGLGRWSLPAAESGGKCMNARPDPRSLRARPGCHW